LGFRDWRTAAPDLEPGNAEAEERDPDRAGREGMADGEDCGADRHEHRRAAAADLLDG
jgi:hypothetical protein